MCVSCSFLVEESNSAPAIAGATSHGSGPTLNAGSRFLAIPGNPGKLLSLLCLVLFLLSNVTYAEYPLVAVDFPVAKLCNCALPFGNDRISKRRECRELRGKSRNASRDHGERLSRASGNAGNKIDSVHERLQLRDQSGKFAVLVKPVVRKS